MCENFSTSFSPRRLASCKICANMNFEFPFQPWSIQQDFMNELYSCLDQGQIGIFSSPTGTGKSLSLICSSLTWLKNHREKLDMESLKNEPDWVKAFALAKHCAAQSVKREAQETPRRKFNKKPKVTLAVENSKNIVHDSQYLVDEYSSDRETDSMARFLDDDKENELVQEKMQVFYCSRTHSQLSQFIKEINKTAFKDIKAVCIGSRKSTCINQSVLKLKSLTRINDACLDLQKKKEKCKHYTEFAAHRNDFVHMVHDSVKDIEELAQLGREVNQCAYYGTREAIKASQVLF